MSRDYYQDLEINRDATNSDVAKAYAISLYIVANMGFFIKKNIATAIANYRCAGTQNYAMRILTLRIITFA